MQQHKQLATPSLFGFALVLALCLLSQSVALSSTSADAGKTDAAISDALRTGEIAGARNARTTGGRLSAAMLRVMVDSLISAGDYDSALVNPDALADHAIEMVYYGSRYSQGYRMSTFIPPVHTRETGRALPSLEMVALMCARSACANSNEELVYNRVLQELDAAVALRQFTVANPEFASSCYVDPRLIRKMLVEKIQCANQARRQK